MDFNTLLERNFVLLDGAMGTMLQRKGLAPGASSELVALEHPEWLEDIHGAYLAAGSNIIYADTFGANREKLARTGRSVQEVVTAAVSVAKRAAAGYDALVALDVGPLGRLLEPAGDMTFDEAYDLFAELMEVGEAAGADLIVLETMADLQELRAGILAAKERTHLPVICTMTFDGCGRTFMGCSVTSMALTAEGLGVDALGINCSLGPRELPGLVESLLQWTTLPLIAKPNAGLPSGEGAGYDITPEEFARSQRHLAQMGVKLLGGCCGTDPDYLNLLRLELQDLEYARTVTRLPEVLCTEGGLFPAADAVCVPLAVTADSDSEELLDDALELAEEENAVICLRAEDPAAVDLAMGALRGSVDAPLGIFASDCETVERALRLCCGRAALVGGEDSPEMIALAKKYGAVLWKKS